MILNHAPFWSNSLAQTSGNIYLLALLTWSLIYYRCITVRAVPVSKSNFVSFIIEANSLQRFCDDQQSQLYETLRIINCSDRIFSQTSHFCFEEDFNPIFLYFTDILQTWRGTKQPRIVPIKFFMERNIKRLEIISLSILFSRRTQASNNDLISYLNIFNSIF